VRARERLDLYTLLNDSDPEIEELRRRLRAMDQTSQAENPPAAPGRPVPSPPSPQAAPRTAGEDIFDLGQPAPRPAAPTVREEPFAELWAPATASPSATPAPATALEPVSAPAVSSVTVEEEPEPPHVLFPGLASRESRQRYLAGLASEGLFHLELIPEEVTAPVAAAAVAVPEPIAELEPIAEPAAPAEPEPIAEPAAIAESEPIAASEPIVHPEPVATATLGELYLRQGYPAEAERIFREVLRREPESAVALQGIAKLSESPAAGMASGVRSLEARDLLAGYQPAGATGPAEGRARKTFLLGRYLERIRRGGQRDVS
jgi:hypothetical protein